MYEYYFSISITYTLEYPYCVYQESSGNPKNVKDLTKVPYRK